MFSNILVSGTASSRKDHLRERAYSSSSEQMSKLWFYFIRQQMKAYPVSLQCAVMRVSRSGFYDYLSRNTSEDNKQLIDAALKRRIKQIFDDSRACYGSSRMVKQLQKQGHQMGGRMVRRIMRQLGVKAKTPKRINLTMKS